MFGRTTRSTAAPIKAAQSWVEEYATSSGKQFIDVSQAAPSDPPPLVLRKAMAEFILKEPAAHRYGAILGMPRLREALAKHCSKVYGSDTSSDNIAITSGCNEAFCATLSTLANEQDEVILVAPWYFNHKMWLDIMGVITRPLICGRNMFPDPLEAEKLISKKTKAICLVSPNNPVGLEYPDKLLNIFLDLANSYGIALVIDETYKDFHSNPNEPHTLCKSKSAEDTLTQLFSFSKSFHLTGHRVGAIKTSPTRLLEIEKFLDTVTICPSQVGQYGAYWGLENLSNWLDEQRNEIQKRKLYLETNFNALENLGWKIIGSGAYFAYVEHPLSFSSEILSQTLVKKAGILCLPGTMFSPAEMKLADHQLRFAFANICSDKIKIFLQRLYKFSLALA